MQYIAYYELNVLLRLKYVLTDSHILRDQRIADRDGTSQYRRYIVGIFFFWIMNTGKVIPHDNLK